MNIEQSCGGVAGSNGSPSVTDDAMVDSFVRLYPYYTITVLLVLKTVPNWTAQQQ